MSTQVDDVDMRDGATSGKPVAGHASAVLAAAEGLLALLPGLDPDILSGADCIKAATQLARTGKACWYAYTRLAARAVACGPQHEGDALGGAQWVASQGGTSIGEARATLALVEDLADMPATREAVATGELSGSQAAQLVRAEQASPGSGERLVELAKTAERSALKQEVRKIISGSLSAEELSKKRRQRRFFRSWTDELGMTCISAALTPEIGQALVSRVERIAARLKKATPATDGRREPFGALAADALAQVLGSGGPRPVRSEVVFVVSYDAYRRGHTHPGEVCHIVGAGPVTLNEASVAVESAFIKALTTDGKDVLRVAHFGRHLPAELRTAVLLGPAPGFEGLRCSHAGCGRSYGLEVDHVQPVSENGLTCYKNLQPLCKPHHRDKTAHDRERATRPWARPPSGPSSARPPNGGD